MGEDGMKIDWSPLKQELLRWQNEERALPIWWRDDDATDVTPQLRTLSELSLEIGLPVHLAVVPDAATPELAKFVHGAPNLIPIVHGWQHRNHAPAGSKKAEFGFPRADSALDLKAAMERMRDLFADDLFPMFVPPWNRIDPLLFEELTALGYLAVSTYLPRAQRCAAPGLVQINTHMDPINWRGNRGLVAPGHQLETLVDNLRDRRAGRTDATEPLGFLTHHLIHDSDIWAFTKACLTTLLEGGATPSNLESMKGNLP